METVTIPDIPVHPRDQEERLRLACLAWCIKHLGGSIRISMNELGKLMGPEGTMVITGDISSDEIIVRLTEHNQPEGTDTPKGTTLFRRASGLTVEEKSG